MSGWVGGWENKQKYSARNSLGHLNGCSACSQALLQISLLFPNFFLLLFTERLTFLSFFFSSALQITFEKKKTAKMNRKFRVLLIQAEELKNMCDELEETGGRMYPELEFEVSRRASKQAPAFHLQIFLFLFLRASQSSGTTICKLTNKQTNKRGRRNHNCDYYYYYYYYYNYTTIRII